jgi:hypothetical protein
VGKVKEPQKMGITDEYSVELFRPQDAKGIVNLVRSVYGDDYPIKIFYDPGALTEANERGDYYSIVARTPKDEVIGVHHLYRSAPFRSLYEWGVGLVLREYRGAGVSNRIGKHVTDNVIPLLGMEEVFGEAVCNHLHTQKMCANAGFIDTALEVALMPAQAYAKEESAAGRVATILQFRCYKPKLQTIFFPRCYSNEIEYLYSKLDDRRTLRSGDEDLPQGIVSKSDLTVFDFAQVARISMTQIGQNFEEHIDTLEAQAGEKNLVVIQVWLKLTMPWVGSAVSILRSKGYFLGGVLPRWFDDDGLLMQKTLCDPCFDDIRLHSEHAKKILEMVMEDWERARSHPL